MPMTREYTNLHLIVDVEVALIKTEAMIGTKVDRIPRLALVILRCTRDPLQLFQ